MLVCITMSHIFNTNYEKKCIVIINSDRRAINARSLKIGRSLSKNNYNVQILTWDRTATKPKHELIDGCSIHNFRFKIPNLEKYTILPFYSIWWAYVVLYLIKTKRIDAVHPLNLYNLIPSLIVKMRKKKIIYDLTDSISDSLAWSSHTKIFLYHMQNNLIKLVDGVILVDEHRRHQINLPKNKKNAIVMNTCEDCFFSTTTTSSRTFQVYCGGWLSESRGINHILRAVMNLDNVKLTLAGYGPYENALNEFNNDPKIEYLGVINPIDSYRLTANADVIVAFYDPTIKINTLASPNKIFEAMMCSKPIIANYEAIPIAKIIKQYNCGILVPYGDVSAIKTAIVLLMNDCSLKTSLGKNGRAAFVSKYDWRFMEKRLIFLYKSILSNTK